MDDSMFVKISSVKADGNIPITKYKSKKTGLTIIIAEVEGPLVNGYFCIATEAHDDDGLPHTLEHLVFMGSEDFPYKGVLDLLANRCLASGTNAWTDTDHTCYTMTNAGSQGFLNLMPIYLDHILYPTLTEAGYITEVHHVNGDGENAGVVYCEMQARENSGESRTHLEFIRAMYPGHCGYKSETGGMMKNLRESTTHEKVCSYHKEFYRPDNLCLVITGQIKAEDVFKMLQPFENKIVSKGSLPTFVRPWQSAVPPLTESVEKVVSYPADDESNGMVLVGWRGPESKNQYTFESVNMLLDYMTDSAISPLQRDFVEIDDPYCSDVHGNIIENSLSSFYFKFDNVLKEKLKDIFPRLTNVLQKLGSGAEKIDMTRMKNIIHRKLLDALSSMEDNPHNKMASYLIGDFLFSDCQADLECRVQTEQMYKRMKTESASYWLDLLNHYMVDKQYVVIIGEPSKQENERMTQTEKDRVAKQRETLGKDGLQNKADILEKATEENEKEAPESVLTSVDVPDVASIFFHSIVPTCNMVDENVGQMVQKQSTGFPLGDIPFKFQLDDIHTNFVQMNVLLDSSCVPQNLKYFLPLYCEVLFESPILRNGVLVGHEEVISELEADTLSTDAGLGVNSGHYSCGSFPQVVRIKLQVEREKYETGVKWLHEVLYCTKFSAERLKVVAKKMSNDISQHKRKGQSVLRALFRSIVFTPDCNHQVNSMLRQNRFLESLLKTLDTNPQQVEALMEQVRGLLTNPGNITVHMSVNVKDLCKDGYNPATVWSTLLPKDKEVVKKSCSVMKKTYDYVVPLSDAKMKSVIVGVGSVESSFLIQAVDCVKSFQHEDLAAIMVFIQYLSQLEGPLWRQIRGLGLSYHYSMYAQPETGLLYFILARSTHIVNAYKEGREIVVNYINGSTEMNEVEFEAAKSSLTFEIIEKETTVSDVTTQSLLAYYKGVPHSYNKDMLKHVSKVTMEDLKRVGTTYISSLFDEKLVRRAVCCNPSKVSEVVDNFKELGIEMEVLPSLEEDFLCSLAD